MTTEVGGTYPTGMLSCFLCTIYLVKCWNDIPQAALLQCTQEVFWYERVARCRHRVKETLVRIKVKVDGLARGANSTHILAGHNTTKISLKVRSKNC